MPKAIEPGLTLRCPQGQKLEWLGLHAGEQLHWFAVREPNPLCPYCWQQSQCPREFSFAPTDHEIVFGTVPVSSVTAKKLLRQVRPWIEATQSYEKNQLGLSRLFLNSLRLTWIMALLADTVSLLRARALLTRATTTPLLFELLPKQINLDFDGKIPK